MTAKSLLKFLKEHEFDVQSAKVSLFVADLCFNSFVNSDVLGRVELSPLYCHMSFDTLMFHEIIEKKTIYKFSKETYSQFLNNPLKLKKIMNERKEMMDKIGYIYRERNLQKMTDSDLIKFYQKLLKLSVNWWKYGVFGEDKGLVIEQEILPKLAKEHKWNISEAREIVNILCHPDTLSVFNLERKDFLNICLHFLKNNKLLKRLFQRKFEVLFQDRKIRQFIQQYIRNYFWFKTNFYISKEITPASLLEDVFSEISKKKEGEIKSELQKMINAMSDIRRQKKKILFKLKLTEKNKKDLEFIVLLTSWQDRRKLEMMRGFFYVFSTVSELSKRIGAGYDAVVSCTTEEFDEILSGRRKFKKREGELFIIYEKNKKRKIYSGDHVKRMLEAVLKVKKENEIKGTVASRGKLKKIQGIARVVFHPEKSKFNKGNILVTSMTRVEFVPLIRRAKAIITDEGGITCHAAIVSRELKIPCIIGTKIATKVLKDGDLIEVDVNKGVVKIIKKAK